MITIIVISIVLVLLALAGAGYYFYRRHRKGGGKTIAPPPLTIGKTLAGYGRVNKWAADKKTLLKDIAACAKYGVKIYHIELFSWDGTVPDTEQERKQMEECYAALISACRKNGMWLFISAFNANLGSGKYGDPGIPLAKYPNEINWALSLVKKHGRENVLLQPMAETGSGFPAQLEAKIAGEFGGMGYSLVNNHGSRPSSKPAWAAWNAWHCWHITDDTPSNQIIVSDTGTCIRELCNGLEGSGKPAQAKLWAARVKADKAPAVVFYHFKYKDHDPETIRAMGEGVK